MRKGLFRLFHQCMCFLRNRLKIIVCPSGQSHSAEWIFLEFSGLFYYSVIKFRELSIHLFLSVFIGRYVRFRLTVFVASAIYILSRPEWLVNTFFAIFYFFLFSWYGSWRFCRDNFLYPSDSGIHPAKDLLHGMNSFPDLLQIIEQRISQSEILRLRRVAFAT